MLPSGLVVPPFQNCASPSAFCQQADLIGDRGLQGQVGRGTDRAAVDQTVVGQAAAVAEQLIDPGAEAAGVADVQRARRGSGCRRR
jgi:hypothetical protein